MVNNIHKLLKIISLTTSFNWWYKNRHLQGALLRALIFNAQYGGLSLHKFNKAHDRFLIIDKTEVFHIGASLKDLGKKWFAFAKMEKDSVVIFKKLGI